MAQRKALFNGLLRWRVGVGWYLVALFGYVPIWLVASAMSGELDSELAKVGDGLALLSTFLIALVAAVPEEIGWRGFALPRLQTRQGALVASLTVGILWTLWHLPLLLTEGNTMSSYHFIPYFLAVITRAVVYTWIYNGSRGSVLMVTIFHAVSNTIGAFVPVEAAITLLVAAIIVIVFGPSHLSGGRQRIEPVVEVP